MRTYLVCGSLRQARRSTSQCKKEQHVDGAARHSARKSSMSTLSLSTVALVLLPAVTGSACAGNVLPADGILAMYFDIAVGSAPGTFVSGRLNP